MEVAKVIGFPGPTDLNAILNSEKLDVVSPFLSKWSLRKIDPEKHKLFRLITRLPEVYHAPVAYLDNDPAPILQAMIAMGKKLQIFALPTVHAKLYMNENSSWVGSANFTKNGFSKKPELLLKFDETPASLVTVFKDYKAQSTLVSLENVQKLNRWCEMGLTKIRSDNPDKNSSPDEAVKVAASFQDFVDWLGKGSGPKQTARKQILAQVNGLNQMSGHVYPAFNGVLAFLRTHPKFIPDLKTANASAIPDDVITSVAKFIRKYGDEYRGVNGGYWRSYLSTQLGGRQVGGGAGNAVVKRSLALLPIYMHDRGLC